MGWCAVRILAVVIIRYLQAIKTMKCVKIKISNLIGGSQTSFYICSKNQILKMEIFAKIQIFEI